MSWTILVLSICFLMAVFAVWKEYARVKKANLVLRIAAALLAVAALACIALPVHYSKSVTALDDHSAMLLTAGFNADSLSNYKHTQLFTANREIKKAQPGAKLIRLDELRTDSPAITRLHVFGYGLTENELKQIAPLPVIFHSPGMPAGIIAVDWNEKLRSGEILKVQGRYKNELDRPVRLVLSGLNTLLDTVSIAAKTSRDFELKASPKNTGRAVYRLQAIAGKDTLQDEHLPVEITPVKELKIWILSASPNFETKFLKNWLAENGFSVAVRSAISKDKFSNEYVNMPAVKTDHLSSSLLARFDLVIGDLSALKSLSTAENGALKQQVTQAGLGVIIRADSSSKTGSWLQRDFPVERSGVKETRPVAVIINGQNGRSAGLKIDPTFIKFQEGTQPLVNDGQKHVLVNSSLAGGGRLVFTTLNNTFNWMLAGDRDDYAAFWSLLIGKAVRKDTANEQWSVSPSLPVVDQPVSLSLETTASPGRIRAGRSALSPAQNPFIAFEWNNKYWPSVAGWQTVAQNNGMAAWWYAFDTHDWQRVKAAEKITATRRYAAENARPDSVTKQIHEKMQIAVPKIYFYLLLLIACTFLWVEGKSAPPTSSRKGGL